jgi:uncharacterized membrane protein YdjX (TVP38/TMEM64 family)
MRDLVSQHKGSEAHKPARRWGRLLLLPVLAGLGLATFFVFHVNQYLTFESLSDHRALLLDWVARDFITAALVFGGVYLVATMLSVPGDALLTIAGGFLFGPFLGTTIAVIAATLGSTILFAVARTSLGEMLRGRSEGSLASFREGFNKNALNYLLFVRFVPLFPFWLVNLASAFLGMPLRTFVVGTFVGIIPGTAVFASIGNGLGAILDRGQKPNLGIIFSPSIFIPLVALAVLSLVPIIYRRLRASKGDTANVQ